MSRREDCITCTRTLCELPHTCERGRIDALLAEQARIWARVTGHTYNDDDSIKIHGVTGDEIQRVARINTEIASLRRQLRVTS